MKRYQLSITIFFLLCALLPGFAQQTKTLTLLQTSDTHSRIEPIDVHAADKYAGMGGFVPVSYTHLTLPTKRIV